jgi:hypothetical protein
MATVAGSEWFLFDFPSEAAAAPESELNTGLTAPTMQCTSGTTEEGKAVFKTCGRRELEL